MLSRIGSSQHSIHRVVGVRAGNAARVGPCRQVTVVVVCERNGPLRVAGHRIDERGRA